VTFAILASGRHKIEAVEAVKYMGAQILGGTRNYEAVEAFEDICVHSGFMLQKVEIFTEKKTHFFSRIFL
jgi:hypothetical protein